MDHPILLQFFFKSEPDLDKSDLDKHLLSK